MKATSDKRQATSTTKIENFCWHEVAEKEKEQIKEESKKLLNEFASKISKIKIRKPKNENKTNENKTGTRVEGDGWNTDEEFREITFANAPFVENDSIITEKATWKK